VSALTDLGAARPQFGGSEACGAAGVWTHRRIVLEHPEGGARLYVLNDFRKVCE
jgi:hypothetical protein